MDRKKLKYGVSGKVDIGDLTWEQKEKVLRFLFARMNGTIPSQSLHKQGALPPISPSADDSRPKDVESELDSTFLTQAQMEQVIPNLALGQPSQPTEA